MSANKSSPRSATTLLRLILVPLSLGLVTAGCSSDDDDDGFVSFGADLTAESLTLSPTTFDQSDAATVTYELRNRAPTAAGAFRVGLYQSSDASITQADTLLSVQNVSGLAGQGRMSVTQSGLVAGPAGAVFLGVVVDDLEQVPELNESNNTASAAGTLNADQGGIDLSVSGYAITPTTADVNDTLDTTFTANNLGASDAGAFRVGDYQSQDDTVTTADSLVQSVNVSSLAGGASQMFNLQSTAASSGTLFNAAIADDLGVITELDETNNTSGVVPVTVN